MLYTEKNNIVKLKGMLRLNLFKLNSYSYESTRKIVPFKMNVSVQSESNPFEINVHPFNSTVIIIVLTFRN